MDVRKFSVDKTPEREMEYSQAIPTDPKTSGSAVTVGSTQAADDREETPEKLLAEHVKIVKDAKIPQSTVMAVLDSILTNEYADLSMTVLGKIPVVFRTRQAWVQTYVLDLVSNENYSVGQFRDVMGKVNLAASIVRYKDEPMLAKNVEDLERNLEWIETLSQHVLSALLRKLVLFDSITVVATSDESIENFTQPPSAA